MIPFKTISFELDCLMVFFCIVSAVLGAFLISFHISDRKNKGIIAIEIISEIINVIIVLLISSEMLRAVSPNVFPDEIILAFFAYSYVVGIIYLVFCILSEKKEKRRVSRTSVRQAFDAVSEGILITDEYGAIILENESMRAIISSILGNEIEDGIDIINSLQDFSGSDTVKKISLYGNYVFKLSDGNAWEFSFSEFTVKKKKLFKAYATDVSETVNASEQTRKNLSAINDCVNSLQWTQENVEGIKKEHGIYLKNIGVHEEIIEELNAICRDLNSEKADRNTAIEHVDALLKKLAEMKSISQEEIFAAYRSAFELLGISLTFIGKVPDGASFVFDVLRKLTFACARLCENKKLTAALYEGNGKVTLTVTGDAPEEIDGGEIAQVKEAISKLGAGIEIETSPSLRAVSVVSL